MRVLTYIDRIEMKGCFRHMINHYFFLNKVVVSEYKLIFYALLFITFFIPSKVMAAEFSALKQGSLMLRQGEEFDSFSSPLVKTDVDMTITGMIARVKVTQEFYNPSNEWVNGHYVFPLPEGAAVDHLILKVGAREFEGQIHPKEKAKSIFKQAKRQGRKASLIEQERPNLFTNSVANIGPFEVVEVILEYQQSVHYNQGEFSLRFPSTLTPRYIPKRSVSNKKNVSSFMGKPDVDINLASDRTDQVSDASRITPPVKARGETDNLFDVNIDIDAGFAISSMSSASHDINLTPITDSRFDVSLQKEVKADRDFLISWRRVDESQPFISHFTQVYQGEEYGLMMLVPPTKARNETSSIPREAVFVLDISGSMEGPSIEQAKSALILGMESLSTNDMFNIVVFNSRSSAYWRSAQKATPNNIISARKFIRRLGAGGGTEMASALELALKSTEEPDYSPYASEVRLKQVIFITDGSVGNEEHLMQVIHQNLKDKRLFTVGIGSAPNTYFMSEAAKVGKGSFTYINDINQVGQKMRGLFAQINHPVLSDIQFDFPANVEFYPDNIPDLYTDQPLLVTYKGSTWGDTIMASGNLTKANWSTTFPPAMLSSTFRDYQRKPTGLNVLWAKNKIEQLTSQRRKSDDREKFNQAIESTALTHHLVSEFTSLVAVDVTPSRPLNVEPKDASIANNLPFGMPKNMLVLPQTATTGQLRFIVGLLLIVISLCLHLITNRR